MLPAPAADLLLSPADSARAVAQVYTISLLATVPLAAAAASAIALRRAPAGTRALVWRSAVVALLIVYLGRHLPVHWMAWVVPAGLASPLVALGRMELGTVQAAPLARTLLVVYWAGVAAVLLPLGYAWLETWAAGRRARPLRDSAWTGLLADTRRALGIHRRVRLLVTEDATVPFTRGTLRPVVLLPVAADRWSEARRRVVLLHELAHVRAADVAFSLAARLACALLWFHPGAWWIARRLRDECELACDDRVLAAGVKPSEYAALLADVAGTAGTADSPGVGRPFAAALSRRAGLRERLVAIVERHDTRAPARASVALAAALTLAVSGPLGVLQLAPTRDVLTSLMRDTNWESRAYAVLGLAQRADSVAVARAAAASDPSPRVRAWAAFALGQKSRPASLTARR